MHEMFVGNLGCLCLGYLSQPRSTTQLDIGNDTVGDNSEISKRGYMMLEIDDNRPLAIFHQC